MAPQGDGHIDLIQRLGVFWTIFVAIASIAHHFYPDRFHVTSDMYLTAIGTIVVLLFLLASRHLRTKRKASSPDIGN